MNQLKLTNGSGEWIMPAKRFEEATRWDGNNHISVATGSQWAHEELILTRKGAWVLRSWSQWQGTQEVVTKVEDHEAHAWLMTNGHDDDVPAEVLAALEV